MYRGPALGSAHALKWAGRHRDLAHTDECAATGATTHPGVVSLSSVPAAYLQKMDGASRRDLNQRSFNNNHQRCMGFILELYSAEISPALVSHHPSQPARRPLASHPHPYPHISSAAQPARRAAPDANPACALALTGYRRPPWPAAVGQRPHFRLQYAVAFCAAAAHSPREMARPGPAARLSRLLQPATRAGAGASRPPAAGARSSRIPTYMQRALADRN